MPILKKPVVNANILVAESPEQLHHYGEAEASDVGYTHHFLNTLIKHEQYDILSFFIICRRIISIWANSLHLTA